jgi:cytochrome c-type biogenesis protein CcmF
MVLLSNRRRHGGYIAHLGIVLIAVGVIGSSFFSVEKAVSLDPEESATVGGYNISFERLKFGESANLATVDAAVHVSKNGSRQSTLEAGRRIHRGWESQPVSSVGIRTVLPRLDDLYVLLSDWDTETGGVTLRVIVNPLVSVIWFGGLVYFAGVLIVAWPGALKREARSVVPEGAARAAAGAGA